jgi:CRP/FNR family transcriptional regulator
MNERVALLAAQPYFAALSETDLEFLRTRLLERHFAKGETIFVEGEPAQGLYIVREGEARIYKLSAEGREQVLRYARAGQSFNEVAVFDGGPNPANVMAATACVLWIVSRELIMEFVRTRPDMAVAIIQNLSRQLRHLVGMVENLALRQVTARLVKLLIETASGDTATHKLTQQEMAAQLGTVREMVGRSLKQLEARGLIKIEKGRIVIVKREELEQLI